MLPPKGKESGGKLEDRKEGTVNEVQMPNVDVFLIYNHCELNLFCLAGSILPYFFLKLVLQNVQDVIMCDSCAVPKTFPRVQLTD